jgi:hypothetical protein
MPTAKSKDKQIKKSEDAGRRSSLSCDRPGVRADVHAKARAKVRSVVTNVHTNGQAEAETDRPSNAAGGRRKDDEREEEHTPPVGECDAKSGRGQDRSPRCGSTAAVWPAQRARVARGAGGAHARRDFV